MSTPARSDVGTPTPSPDPLFYTVAEYTKQEKAATDLQLDNIYLREQLGELQQKYGGQEQLWIAFLRGKDQQIAELKQQVREEEDKVGTLQDKVNQIFD